MTATAGRTGNGHLIVCVGFTETGDVVANDPGVSVKRNERARRVYPRQRVISAWKKSENAVYLIYTGDVQPSPPVFARGVNQDSFEG